MFALLLTPAVLSLLLLAAHYLRRGQWQMCLPILGLLLTLLALRRPWVPRVTQVVLGLAAIVWGLTTATLVRQRIAEHGDVGRLAAILGAVIAVNLLAAALLGTRRVRERYAGIAAGGSPR